MVPVPRHEPIAIWAEISLKPARMIRVLGQPGRAAGIELHVPEFASDRIRESGSQNGAPIDPAAVRALKPAVSRILIYGSCSSVFKIADDEPGRHYWHRIAFKSFRQRE